RSAVKRDAHRATSFRLRKGVPVRFGTAGARSPLGGTKRGPSGPLLLRIFDRHADHAAPLGPGTVVVAHVRKAQKLPQDEPAVRGALADPAVGDDLLVRGDAFLGVQPRQLLGRFEGAVFV